MSKRVFHINAEVLPVTHKILDPNKVAGAVVRCLVAANSEEAAISSLSTQLQADGLELSETEWCVDFDSTEWENSDDTFEKDLAEHALRTGVVQYGEFHTWGHNKPDAY